MGRKRVLWIGAIILAGITLLVSFGVRDKTSRVFDFTIPEGVYFKDARESAYFNVHAVLEIRQQIEKDPMLIYDILLTNATDGEIYNINVRAMIDPAMKPFLFTGVLTFGLVDHGYNLIPGEKPWGHWIGRITQLHDFRSLSKRERRLLYSALHKPIRMEVTWDGGREYLEIKPDDIEYKGLEIV